MPRERLLGYVFVLVSASAFGIMPSFAVLAYRDGLSVTSVLFYRFAIASAVFVPFALWRARRTNERPPARAVAVGLAMGAVLYAGQAACFFTSVRLSTPALGALLLYLYPGLVAVGASVVARRRPGPGLVLALLIAFAGIVLSLGAPGGVNAGAVLFGLGAAVSYTAYILVGNHNGRSLSSVTMSALVFASAALTYLVLGLATHELALPPRPRTWGVVLALGLLCTVIAIWFFFLGMERVGPTMASLGSTLEPVCAVAGGAVLLGTRMTALQAAGAVLVLVGAVLGILLTPATSHPDEDAAVPVHEPAH